MGGECVCCEVLGSGPCQIAVEQCEFGGVGVGRW